MEVRTDSSVHGGVVHCGMVCRFRWREWPSFGSASLSAKELLPIVVVATTWGRYWRGRVVVCLRSACLFVCLFLEARYDLMLRLGILRGWENSLADAILRNRFDMLFDLSPQVCCKPAKLNLEVVRSLVLKSHWTSDTWNRWLAAL